MSNISSESMEVREVPSSKTSQASYLSVDVDSQVKYSDLKLPKLVSKTDGMTLSYDKPLSNQSFTVTNNITTEQELHLRRASRNTRMSIGGWEAFAMPMDMGEFGKTADEYEAPMHDVDEGDEDEKNLQNTLVSPETRFTALTGIRKFKKVAQLVKTNLIWAKDMEDGIEVEESHEDNNARFDVNQFKTKNTAYGGVTKQVRRILIKHPNERSEAELNILQEVIERLKSFRQYSKTVKHELARVLFYVTYDDGRVIIRQGHIGNSFYFIISGSVVVKITEEDKESGRKHTQILAELSEGSCFGESALLHNIRRTATIVCKGRSEFLRIDKQDFEAVLKVSIEMEWQSRYRALTSLRDVFHDIAAEDLKTAAATCKIQEYSADKVLSGNQIHTPDYVEFILSGECLVIREIILMAEQLPTGHKKLIMPTLALKKQAMAMAKKGRRDPRGRTANFTICGKPERHLWVLFTMKRGSYFGVGEDLTDTYIISKSKVEVILVPRIQFMKLGRSRLLEKLRLDFNAAMPSNEAAFHHYIKDLKWDIYKNKVVNDVIRRRSVPNVTKESDVPYAIRLESRPRDQLNYLN